MPSRTSHPDGVVDASPLREAVGELAEEGSEGRQPDDQQDEDACCRDEDEVDELRPCSRPPALDLHRRLQPEADRRHHPGRAPEERDERNEADRRERARDALDRLRDVGLSRLGDGEDVHDLVDHVLPELVVLEHEPEDRDEGDGQGKSENSTR